MGYFLTVIITILVVLLLDYILGKIFAPYIRKIIDSAINIICYVETYHWSKTEERRFEIGAERFYKEIFENKGKEWKKDLSDRIFYVFYTQIIDKPLNVVPARISMYNGRCLAEGEERGTGNFVDSYLEEQEKEYSKYATKEELEEKEAINSVENESN